MCGVLLLVVVALVLLYRFGRNIRQWCVQFVCLCLSKCSWQGPPPKKKKKRKVSVSTCNSCYESTNIFGSSEIGGHSAAEALAGFEGGDNSLVNTACCSRCRYTRWRNLKICHTKLCNRWKQFPPKFWSSCSLYMPACHRPGCCFSL